MKTILIPIDFSETSRNAVAYAAALSKDTKIERIILLKSFYTSIYEQVLPSADFVQLSAEEVNEERTAAQQRLKEISENLFTDCNACVKVVHAISELPLLRAVQQVIESEKPDLLLMGSDGPGADTSIGSKVIAIAKTSPIPTLVIPSDFTYQPIKQALIPCDFSAVSRLDPLRGSHVALDWFSTQLSVLNVDAKLDHLDHEDDVEILKEFLESYQFKVYYSQDPDTLHGILDFANTHPVDLIVALPGRYSFFYKFTHRSITEALTINARQPVLILK